LLALALVMILNPLAVVSAGFWFSFIAVAALLLCLDLSRRDGDEASTGSRIIHLYIRPQLIVFVALTLPLIFWTQQLPLLSPLINVFAIPLVALFVVPLCLLAL
jgi:competence protein ComEC